MYFLLSLYIVNRVVSGEIYTAGKNFTLPQAVTALTNLTSGKTIIKMVKCLKTCLKTIAYLILTLSIFSSSLMSEN